MRFISVIHCLIPISRKRINFAPANGYSSTERGLCKLNREGNFSKLR